MAKELNDVELCLPSEFLVEDFFLEKEEKKNRGPLVDLEEEDGEESGGLCFPSEFPYDHYDLDPSLSGESMTETESDEEEQLVAGLSLQMFRSSLLTEHNDVSTQNEENPKVSPFFQEEEGLLLATSPQSTLSGMRSWSMSSRGSSNHPSQLPSQLTPVDQQPNDAWDSSHTSAGKEEEELNKGQDQCSSSLPSLLGPAGDITTNIGCYYSDSAHNTQNVIQAERIRQLKQQLLKQQFSLAWEERQGQRQTNKAREGGYGPNSHGRFGGVRRWSQSPVSQYHSHHHYRHHHHHQQQQQQQQVNGSGMRAVFLGRSPGCRKESGGTGVFLPRSAGSNPTPSCSTVLLPARVVQALKLDLDEIGAQPIFPGGYHLLDHGWSLCYHLPSLTSSDPSDFFPADSLRARNAVLLQQKNRTQQLEALDDFNKHDMRLPSDWAY